METCLQKLIFGLRSSELLLFLNSKALSDLSKQETESIPNSSARQHAKDAYDFCICKSTLVEMHSTLQCKHVNQNVLDMVEVIHPTLICLSVGGLSLLFCPDFRHFHKQVFDSLVGNFHMDSSSNALSKKHMHSFWDMWVLLWVIWCCDGFGWCNDTIVSSSCGPELLRQDPGAHIKTWWPITTGGLSTSNAQILRHFPCFAHTHTHTSQWESVDFSQCHPRLTPSDKKRKGLLSVSLRCSWRSPGCITFFDREALLQEIFIFRSGPLAVSISCELNVRG